MARKKMTSPVVQQQNDRLVDIVRDFECLGIIAMATSMRTKAKMALGRLPGACILQTIRITKTLHS